MELHLKVLLASFASVRLGKEINERSGAALGVFGGLEVTPIERVVKDDRKMRQIHVREMRYLLFPLRC